MDSGYLLRACATATADSGAGSANTAATASVNAPDAHESIYIFGVRFSASAAPAAAVQATLVDSAGANRGRWEIPASAFAPAGERFDPPLKIAVGKGATLTLPALGAGVIGVAQFDYDPAPA